MKPHVACIVFASLDGRTWLSRWSPDPKPLRGLFEHVHDELGADAWLIGRTTGQEYSKRQAYPAQTSETFPRENWFARRDAKAWGVVLDAQARSLSVAPTSAAIRSSRFSPNPFPTRIWQACAAKACPMFSRARPSSISPWCWIS
jgi:hypothetical protein